MEDEWLKDPSKKDKPPMSEKKEGIQNWMQKTFGEHDKKAKKRRGLKLRACLIVALHKLLKHLNTGGQKPRKNRKINQFMINYGKKSKGEEKTRRTSGKAATDRCCFTTGKNRQGDCAYWKEKAPAEPDGIKQNGV